jgi:hypothetical protein
MSEGLSSSPVDRRASRRQIFLDTEAIFVSETSVTTIYQSEPHSCCDGNKNTQPKSCLFPLARNKFHDVLVTIYQSTRRHMPQDLNLY